MRLLTIAALLLLSGGGQAHFDKLHPWQYVSHDNSWGGAGF